ncbi:MAG: C4-dicarboxylate ABC transporter substrate-binding protein [Leptospiraceae bacterium]|nr:MAG: C4-dicarboxylate ABC transporter substrate-binding protein [Leptospiraceae bacterium]
MDPIEKWIIFSEKIDKITEKIGTLIYWLTLFMVIISAYNAIARYLGKYIGIDATSNALIELQWYTFSVIFLLGAAYGLKHNAHVKVDVIYNLWSDKVKTYINIIGTIFFLFPFCILMIYVSIPAVINSWKVLEMSPDPGGLPRYPLKTLKPIAFILLFLQGISYLIKNIAHLKKGYQIEEEEQITEKTV